MRRTVWFTLVAGAVLLLGVEGALAKAGPAQPGWVGVWRGSIGTAPVTDRSTTHPSRF